MRILLIILTSFLLLDQIFAIDQKTIPEMDFDEFENNLHQNNDSIYIINFWATWCVPCRKELPDFEKIHLNYKDKGVKVLLVSLDFPTQIESGLIPFLEERNITAKVILLNDPNSNSWIDKVDPTWSGALPATVIYKGNVRKFFEEELYYIKIEKSIHELNNH